MNSDDLKNKAKDAADQISQSSRTTSETVKSAADEQAGSISDLASRAGDHARAIGEKASDAAGIAYDRVSESARRAAGSLPDSASDALAKGQRAVGNGGSQVADQVRKQPLEALLLAAAIGYLVGWATNRS